VIGELLLDLIPARQDPLFADSIEFQTCVGGAPTNVAVTCHLLGARVSLMSFVGQDWAGEWLLERLRSLRLDTTNICHLQGELTPIAIVRPGGQAEGRFEIHPGWLSSPHVSINRFAEQAEDYEYLYFGSCILSNPYLADQMQAMLHRTCASGCLTIFDANIRLPLWKSRSDIQERIEPFLPWVHVLKTSAEEAALLFGAGTVDQQMDRAHEAGVWCVVITNGASPVVYSVDDARGKLDPLEAHRFDSTGSGDVFVGAMISYIMSRERCEVGLPRVEMILDALSFAVSVATKSAAFPSATSMFSHEDMIDDICRMMVNGGLR